MLKGIKGGVLIEITNIEKDLEELQNKLSGNNFFGKNTDFLLKEENKKYFKQVWEILDKFGHNLYVYKEVVTEKIVEKIKEVVIEPEKNDDEESLLIVRKTLRSGQKVESDNSILIIGDVNPGSEVFAGGDVYVFGRARGIIHAGKNGDKERMILALSLEVNQIRIANVYAKSSGEKPEGRVSEKAFLDENNNLIVEEYKIW